MNQESGILPPRYLLADELPCSQEQEENALIKASQQGDQQAFALLVRHHQQRVFAVSQGILHNPDDASEATQEAFVAAWQGLPGFRGDALFSTWLYRITYRCCLHILKARQHDYLVREAIQEEQIIAQRGVEQQIMREFEREERLSMIKMAFAHLPLTYRMVLQLRYLQDRTYEEMAELLAMPLGTIKTSLFRARRMLKDRIVWLSFEPAI